MRKMARGNAIEAREFCVRLPDSQLLSSPSKGGLSVVVVGGCRGLMTCATPSRLMRCDVM